MLPRDGEGRPKPDTAVATLLTALSLSSPGWAARVTSHAPCGLRLGSQPLSSGPTKARVRPTVTSGDSTAEKGPPGVGQGNGMLLPTQEHLV